MNEIVSLQLFLAREKPEPAVLEAIAAAIGFSVESTDVPVADAIGFVQFTYYTEGFEQGILISWSGVAPLPPYLRSIAQRMAVTLGTVVLLEPPDGNEAWIIATENGSLATTTVSYLDDGVAPSN